MALHIEQQVQQAAFQSAIEQGMSPDLALRHAEAAVLAHYREENARLQSALSAVWQYKPEQEPRRQRPARVRPFQLRGVRPGHRKLFKEAA